MKKYYYNSFRGFSNEAEIISVDQKNIREVMLFDVFLNQYEQSSNINWQLHRITAQEAREIVSGNRATKRAYERAGLNLTCNPVGPTEITTCTDFFRNTP